MDETILPVFDLPFAVQLARGAGEIIRSHFDPKGVAYIVKGDTTPLTEADLGAQEYVIKEVSDRYPHISIIGEERSHIIPGARLRLRVDPVDGTHHFRCGIPTFTFMLALCDNARVVLSVIYDPIADKMYTAVEGQGAHMNGQAIQGRADAQSIRGEIILVETSPRAPAKWQTLTARVLARGGYATTMLSFGFQAALVAEGKYGGLLFGGSWPHDAAPAYRLLRESGHTVTDMDFNEPDYSQDRIRGLIAGCTPLVYAELAELVRNCNE